MTPYAYDWNYKVLKEFFEEADYISMHHYIGTVGKSRFLRELRKEMSEVEFHLGMHEYMQEVADSYEIIKSDILHVCSDKKKIRKIGIALDEYNPWYNTLPEPKLMHMYNISDALLVGRYFNLFIQKADVATISNMAQLVNVLPAVVTKSGESGFFRQGISYIPEMYLGNQGNIAVDVFLESESYPGKYYRDAKYVDSSASLSPDGDFVTLNLINIHPEKSFDYEVIVPGKEIASIEGSCLSEMDLAAYNTFEDPDRLKIQRIQAFEGNQIQIPAMACMVLKLRLK
ncbi:MAG TPA: hypothetical protein DD727_06505 [Clostridiales bacterium]|nr:hypothetical protein [Clostridiales bacterium]